MGTKGPQCWRTQTQWSSLHMTEPVPNLFQHRIFWCLCSHRWDRNLNFSQPWVGSTLMDGHWLWPPPHPQAPSLINDLVFLIYEQPLQTRVGAPYGPACPAQLE